MYHIDFFWTSTFCSSARGSFHVLSVAGHAGGPREQQVWASAKVRGMCFGGSKSRNLASNHGIRFRLPGANQAYGTPNNFRNIRIFPFSTGLRSVFHSKPPPPSPPAREATTITTSKSERRAAVAAVISQALRKTHQHPHQLPSSTDCSFLWCRVSRLIMDHKHERRNN